MIHPSSLLLLSLLCLPGADPAAKGPVFVVHTAAGNPVKGTLKQIDDTWSVLLEGAAPKVGGADLISLRRLDRLLPAPPADAQVLFINGDRLRGKVGELKGDRLSFTMQIGQPQERINIELKLPLSALAVLWFDNPAGMEHPDLVRRRLLAEKRTRETVWLRNGDIIQGNLLKLDPQGLDIEVDRKEVKVEGSKIAVIALNNELARTLLPKERYAQLVLADGSRLGLASARSDGPTLTATTLFGETVTVPLDHVISLDIRQGQAVYLSDLKPASYEYSPYLPGLAYSWMADGCVGDGSPAGDDLRLGGATYVKGLGMHSESRITYALDAHYRRFEAVVGLDDRFGQKGKVRLQVLADGKPRDWGWDKELTARDGPQEVRLDVKGVRELTLVVEYGRFDQGQVNWADARLVK